MGSVSNRFQGLVAQCTLLALLLLPTTSQADTDRGAIEGQVLDSEGRPLIQVLVSLEGNDLVRARKQETDDQGRFRFDRLRPGTYRVLICEPGFGRYEEPTVTVAPGTTVRLEIELQLDPFDDPEQPILSFGQRRALDWTADSTGLVLTRDQLDLLPLGRNPWSALWLSPAALSSVGTILAISPVFSSFRIAGVDVDQAFGLSAGASLPMAMVEAVTIGLERADAQTGFTPGAAVELHPRWGGRKPWLDGEVFLWPGGLAKADATDLAVGRLSLGSPLWGNRLQAIASLRVDMEHIGGQSQDNYFDPADPEPLTRPDKDYWGTDWLAGLRYRASSSHRLEALTAGRYSRSRPLPSSTFTAPEAQLGSAGLWNLVGLTWEADWLDWLRQRTQLGFFRRTEHLGPTSGCTSPSDEGCRSHYDQDTGLATGNASTDQRSAQTRVQFETRLTGSLDDLFGDHRLEIGLQTGHGWLGTRETIPGGGTYTDRSGRPYRVTLMTLDQTGSPQPLETREKSDWVGLYLQERWSPTPGLSIIPGLRWDWAQVETSDHGPSLNRRTLGPALTVLADPIGDGKTRLMAGLSRTGQIRPMHMRWFPQAVLETETYEYNPATGQYDTFVRRSGGDPGVIITPGHNPERADAVVLQVGRELAPGLALLASASYRSICQTYQDNQTNLIWNQEGTDVIGYGNGDETYIWSLGIPRTGYAHRWSGQVGATYELPGWLTILASYQTAWVKGPETSTWIADYLSDGSIYWFEQGSQYWHHALRAAATVRPYRGISLGLALTWDKGPADRWYKVGGTTWGGYNYLDYFRGYSRSGYTYPSWDKAPDPIVINLRLAIDLAPWTRQDMQVVFELMDVADQTGPCGDGLATSGAADQLGWGCGGFRMGLGLRYRT